MKTTLLVTAALASALLLSSCSREPLVANPTPEPPSVTAAKVTRQDLAKEVEIAGQFRAYQEIDLNAKVAGYLRSITVDVGDWVRTGQVIGIIEVPEMSEDRAQASASEKRSEAEVVRARSEVERAASMLTLRELSYNRLAAVAKTRPNLIAQQEIDDASAKYQEAKAQLAVAKAAVAATEQQVQVSGAGRARVDTMMSYLRITAPFAGVVTKRYADTGAMIQAGTASQTQAKPVIRLAEVDRLRLVLPVPESIVTRIRIGTPVEVRVDSISRVFQAKVSRFTSELDPSTRTMGTEVDVANPGAVLKAGMFAYATIVLDQHSDTLAIPIQALGNRGATSEVKVWAVNAQDQAEHRTIRLGIETADHAEVLSGLKEGELVVIGASNLQPHMSVVPKIVALDGHAQ